MTYFEHYKKRVIADGNNLAESYTNSSKELVNYSFADSPTFAVIDIGGDMYDVRITSGKTSNDKRLLLRPDVKVDIGTYATIDNEKWLVMDYSKNVTTPVASVSKAEEVLSWMDTDGTTVLKENCVLQSALYEDQRDGKYFYTPKGNVNVYVALNDTTKKIYVEQRFIFGNSVFKVSDIDDYQHVENNVGYLFLHLEKTEKHAKDNFVDKIAYNDSRSVADVLDKDDDGNGGGGWLS